MGGLGILEFTSLFAKLIRFPFLEGSLLAFFHGRVVGLSKFPGLLRFGAKVQSKSLTKPIWGNSTSSLFIPRGVSPTMLHGGPLFRDKGLETPTAS